MLNNTQIVTEQLMMAEMPDPLSRDRHQRNACRTRTLVDDFYLCQTNRSDCQHAFPFGMSRLCRSSERSGFAM